MTETYPGSTPADVYTVVMAGGGGTRFWPVSRPERPKQLLPLFGEQTLLEQTLERMQPLAPWGRTFVVTTAALAGEVRRLAPALPAAQVLAEPAGRNTAAAIAFAAVAVRARDPRAVMAVVPADHFIGDAEAFTRIAHAATRYAGEGHIVTLGVPPTRPETAYGYIRFADFAPLASGDPVDPQARRVAAFVEKPDAETALGYLREGRYLWNAGLFFATAERMLAEIARWLPELAAGVERIAEALGTPREREVLEQVYPTLPSTSIDYGVMERAEGVLVIPANIRWSDVGSWSVLDDLAGADVSNAAFGDVVAVESEGNVLFADEGSQIAALGLQGLVVAVSGGRVLVCPKERAQEVRRLVEQLAARAGGESRDP